MRVGVTGHQNLGAPPDVAWVQSVLRQELEQPSVTSGVTSLAAGADQLFAATLRSLGKPYTVLVPSAGYEDTFHTGDQRDTYRSLLADADEVIRLAFREPSEAAYWEAGKQVVGLANFMIAVWDGLPARGLGGTGDVVRHALEQGLRVIHCNPRTHTTQTLGPERT